MDAILIENSRNNLLKLKRVLISYIMKFLGFAEIKILSEIKNKILREWFNDQKPVDRLSDITITSCKLTNN
jgi:hypothetical protein